MAQVTAKSKLEVMLWVETTQHHIISAETEGFMILKGHHDILRIPAKLFKTCHLKVGGKFDERTYRWDFDKHKELLKKRRRKPKKRSV